MACSNMREVFNWSSHSSAIRSSKLVRVLQISVHDAFKAQGGDDSTCLKEIHSSHEIDNKKGKAFNLTMMFF